MGPVDWCRASLAESGFDPARCAASRSWSAMPWCKGRVVRSDVESRKAHRWVVGEESEAINRERFGVPACGAGVVSGPGPSRVGLLERWLCPAHPERDDPYWAPLWKLEFDDLLSADRLNAARVHRQTEPDDAVAVIALQEQRKGDESATPPPRPRRASSARSTACARPTTPDQTVPSVSQARPVSVATSGVSLRPQRGCRRGSARWSASVARRWLILAVGAMSFALLSWMATAEGSRVDDGPLPSPRPRAAAALAPDAGLAPVTAGVATIMIAPMVARIPAQRAPVVMARDTTTQPPVAG